MTTTKSEDTSGAPLHERVVALETQMSPSERRVARFLADHPALIASSTAAELAHLAGSSDATVVRTVKALGYSGLPGLKRLMVQAMVDQRNPARLLGQRIDQLEGGTTTADQVLAATANLMQQARRLIEPEAWHTAVNLLESAHSILAYGIEQAGCVAEFFAIEMSRSGKPTRSLTQSGIGVAHGLLPLTKDDAVLVIAPLRHFREIDVVIDHAHTVGATVLLISEALGLSLQDRVDAALATPQTTFGPSSEIFVSMALVRSLVLEVASRNPDRAIATTELVNELRYNAVGAELDVEPPGFGRASHRPKD